MWDFNVRLEESTIKQGQDLGWEQKQRISIDLGSAQVRDVLALVGEFQMCLVATAWSKCNVIPGGAPPSSRCC